MLRSGRRLVYAAGYRAAMAEAHRDLQKLAADLQAEANQLRAELAELRATVAARLKAESELRELYRQRSIQRARATERDPTALLQ